MNAEKKKEKEQDKIILPKEIQVEMMKFFLKTSIPRKKKQELQKSQLSNTTDRGEE